MSLLLLNQPPSKLCFVRPHVLARSSSSDALSSSSYSFMMQTLPPCSISNNQVCLRKKESSWIRAFECWTATVNGEETVVHKNRHQHGSVFFFSGQGVRATVSWLSSFFGPQISFCIPGNNYGWINLRMENSCFYSSRVMFSDKHEAFRMVGSKQTQAHTGPIDLVFPKAS
ncbi:unnamed protein product [Cochlearia groenlandica]